MSDHLDYIRIKHLEDSASEVFQGLSTGIATTTTTPTPTPTTTKPGEQETGLLDAIIELFRGLEEERQKSITPPDPTREMPIGSRQLALPLPKGSWLIDGLFALALRAGGGPLAPIFWFIQKRPVDVIAVSLAVSAVAKVFDVIEETFDDTATNDDRNRLIEILETAFLKSEGISPFKTEKSLLGEILKKGLTHLPPDTEDTDDNRLSTLKEGLLELIQAPGKPDVLQSYLARLSDQDWQDLELAFGDDVKLRVKGKTLHF